MMSCGSMRSSGYAALSRSTNARSVSYRSSLNSSYICTAAQPLSNATPHPTLARCVHAVAVHTVLSTSLRAASPASSPESKPDNCRAWASRRVSYAWESSAWTHGL
jgi:hypothetical protein